MSLRPVRIDPREGHARRKALNFKRSPIDSGRALRLHDIPRMFVETDVVAQARKRRIRGAGGFTLAEVLVATAVMTIGLVAIGMGFQYATSGVATGRGETTAVFLAEQRVEQLKAQAVANFSAAALAAGTTTEYCTSTTACQGAAVTGPSYRRITTIADIANAGVTGCPVAPLSCKEIRVQVMYRPVTSSGDLSMQRTVDVFTILAPRT